MSDFKSITGMFDSFEIVLVLFLSLGEAQDSYVCRLNKILDCFMTSKIPGEYVSSIDNCGIILSGHTYLQPTRYK